MRSPRLPLLCIAVLLAAACGARASGPRAQADLGPGWRFLLGDEPRASDPAFDDSAWQAIDLPHTWNGLDGQDGGGNYHRGPGWYRRHYTPDAALGGRQLYLQFDGACLKADVYLNGVFVGSHTGGFARFRFDVTRALRVGADNVIAVRVDNSSLGIPPNEADFTICGGLYRGVSLLATDPVQVATMDMASPGVFVEQRSVSADSAAVVVRAELENHAATPHEVDVRVAVFDSVGGAVPGADSTSRVHLDASGSTEVARPLSLTHPHLWNGRVDPYMYTVRVELRPVAANGSQGTISDSVDQPMGLRSFEVDPDRGFILNGMYLNLYGFNRHQDRPDKGWAISDADEAEDFGFVMEIGATAMRSSHYQQSDSWYSRCDGGGIVVWAEIPSWGLGLATPEYLASAKQQLRELVRQNFNHPSICFWGVGNETRGPAADAVAAALAPVAHEEDPGRLSTYASNHDARDPKNWHTDVVAFNRYYGWYSKSVTDFTDWLVQTRAEYPRARYGMSEFGAGASIHQHQENPPPPVARGPFHPEEYQALYHEAYWADLKTRPYLWCKFIWCLFDFASDGRNEGDHAGRNDKGLVTYDRRVRKDAFYFYKANWSADPVLHIAASRFTARTSPVTEVKVYSNAPEVELEVNGVSLGTARDPSGGRVFRWPGVRLSPGDNRVTARAAAGGAPVQDSCVWTLSTP
jgi:beta-galactosidase